MSDERIIEAISYELNNLRSPTQIYDVMTGQLKPYDDPTREDVDIPTGSLYTISGVLDDEGNLRKMSIAELVMCVCLERATKEEEKIIGIMAEMSENTNILNHLSSIENELLAGKKIEDITGEYEHYGKKYTSAVDYLVIVFNDSKEILEKRANLDDIITRLEAGEAIHSMSGSYAYNGIEYDNAANYIWNIPNLKINVAQNGTYYFQSMMSFIDAYPHLSESEKLNYVKNTLPTFFDATFTVDGCIDELERHAAPQIVAALQEEYYRVDFGDSSRSEIKAMSTDDLITKLETKMDSLNSFSQRKMLELQSETNKRDQAYDLITNVLKSLNTVQVGIANNI